MMPGGAEQFDRRDQHLLRRDRRARIDDAEACERQRAKMQQRAGHVGPGADQQQSGEPPGEPRRRVQPGDERGFEQKRQAPGQQHAEAEGERAEADDGGHLRRGEALRRIGAISRHPGREDGRADVVGERVGHERDHADEAPIELAAEMGERKLIVAGERAIGHDGRGGGERPARRGDGREGGGDLRHAVAAKLAVEQKA